MAGPMIDYDSETGADLIAVYDIGTDSWIVRISLPCSALYRRRPKGHDALALDLAGRAFDLVVAEIKREPQREA